MTISYALSELLRVKVCFCFDAITNRMNRRSKGPLLPLGLLDAGHGALVKTWVSIPKAITVERLLRGGVFVVIVGFGAEDLGSVLLQTVNLK